VEYLVFYVFAAFSVGAAVMVVAQKRAVYSALSLIVCLGALAGLFFQLGAPFIAAIQVIVYAGAIMVLFVFVIMLIDPDSEIYPDEGLNRSSFWAFPLGVVFIFLLTQAFPDYLVRLDRGVPAQGGTVEELGRSLFTDYVLPFEATSILILVAIIGAIVLARRSE
jgi:NADH-quinone oxidoreductase subunit J